MSAVSVREAGEGVRLTLELSRDAVAQVQFLGAPKPRFVVDLPAASWQARPVGAVGLAIGVRHGQHSASTRIVVDLASEARLAGSHREAGADGRIRLMFDLLPAGQRLGQAQLAVMPVAPAEPPLSEPSPAPRKTGQKIVVIDPGHGGQDPGALGKAQGREKDYNLAAALVLREQLQARGYQVLMTRQTDVFLPLGDRVKMARERRADLFISLHSDADPKGAAKGATVYTLSQRGVQRSKGLMNGQDWHVDVGDAGGAARSILIDLTQRETKDHSTRFAESLIDRLQDAAPLARRTPASAGFFVLLAPDVPAVLLEMGYVTHAEDERRLADSGARRSLMRAVADSVDEYFERRQTYASVSP